MKKYLINYIVFNGWIQFIISPLPARVPAGRICWSTSVSQKKATWHLTHTRAQWHPAEWRACSDSSPPDGSATGALRTHAHNWINNSLHVDKVRFRSPAAPSRWPSLPPVTKRNLNGLLRRDDVWGHSLHGGNGSQTAVFATNNPFYLLARDRNRVCVDCLFSMVRSPSQNPYGAHRRAPKGRPTRTPPP